MRACLPKPKPWALRPWQPRVPTWQNMASIKCSVSTWPEANKGLSEGDLLTWGGKGRQAGRQAGRQVSTWPEASKGLKSQEAQSPNGAGRGGAGRGGAGAEKLL